MNLGEQLKSHIASIKGQRHQFLLLNTQINTELSIIVAIKQLGATPINVSLLLANKLKMLPSSKRQRAVKNILIEAINEVESEIVYFERIQYLFDQELNQEPMKLFEYLSGNKVLVVKWPGEISIDGLRYATPDHPEYYRAEGYQEHIVSI